VRYEVEPRAGLRLGDTELVLQTERPDPETDFLVDSAEAAVRRVEELGGRCFPGRKTSRSDG
jgi:hypothetical protein